MVMDPTLPRIKVRDLLMQAFLTGWERWNRQTHWVLESDEAAPLLCQLQRGARPRAPFTWRPGTWHLYAPGTAYRLCYPLPLRAHRNRWVQLAVEWLDDTFSFHA